MKTMEPTFKKIIALAKLLPLLCLTLVFIASTSGCSNTSKPKASSRADANKGRAGTDLSQARSTSPSQTRQDPGNLPTSRKKSGEEKPKPEPEKTQTGEEAKEPKTGKKPESVSTSKKSISKKEGAASGKKAKAGSMNANSNKSSQKQMPGISTSSKGNTNSNNNISFATAKKAFIHLFGGSSKATTSSPKQEPLTTQAQVEEPKPKPPAVQEPTPSLFDQGLIPIDWIKETERKDAKFTNDGIVTFVRLMIRLKDDYKKHDNGDLSVNFYLPPNQDSLSSPNDEATMLTVQIDDIQADKIDSAGAASKYALNLHTGEIVMIETREIRYASSLVEPQGK